MDIFTTGASRRPYQHDAKGAMFDDAIASPVRARPAGAPLA
ncbi:MULTISPECIES: hypothetical protein [Mameliella]|nr:MULTISPECIES: hypothetical protein [Mameliella]MCR9275597.1 hypothetical protein [Paracoccaceae bacterium]MDD9731445.1 hypothetical protein [Mameliella sp. AT18]